MQVTETTEKANQEIKKCRANPEAEIGKLQPYSNHSRGQENKSISCFRCNKRRHFAANCLLKNAECYCCENYAVWQELAFRNKKRKEKRM